MRRRWRRILLGAAAVLTVLVVAASLAVWNAYRNFRPVAVTLGPQTTIYFQHPPPLSTRVHEAVHRRQMREKSFPSRMWSAFRYNFDYGYRLEEEAEARAAEICLQIHRFSSQLPAYTAARSLGQARAYRAWAWEKIGMDVPDRVGERLRDGEACGEILRGVELDLPPDERLSEEDELRLAAFHFLRSYGSRPEDVAQWKARLRLVGFAAPAPWDFREAFDALSRIPVGRAEALPPDDSITPGEAGTALHRVLYHRTLELPAGVRRVSSPYRGWPLLGGTSGRGEMGIAPREWPRLLLGRAAVGRLDGARAEWLERMDQHPAHADFEIFARAPTADVAGARYRIPFSSGMSWDRLPPPDIEVLQEIFLAQWGRAALALHRGEHAEAERLMRLVVSASLQLLDNAPHEVEAIQGLEFLRAGLAGLDEVRELRGLQGGEEEGVEEGEDDSIPGDGAPGELPGEDLETAPGPDEPTYEEWWARNGRVTLLSRNAEELYRALPYLVVDETIPYALRLLGYRQVVLYDVCLHRRGAEGSPVWRSRVEEGLVRRPSDRALLELARGRVADLLDASGVPPAAVCSEERVAHPTVRLAIMGLVPPVVPVSGYGDS